MSPGRHYVRRLVVALAASLVIGWIFASIYSSFQNGITKEAIDSFSFFAFWHDTPVYQGDWTPAFYTGLKIIACTIVIVMTIAAVKLAERYDHLGTARWARMSELKQAGYLMRYSRITGPVFGKTSKPRWHGSYLGTGDHAHSLVVAPTRAGKGVGVVIPTLLTFRGSVLALDVKGELFELTSRARQSLGHRIYKFAPYDPHGRSHTYNPLLDIMAMPEVRRFSEARRMAVNMIIARGKSAEGFLEGARDLFVAGILVCIERGTPTISAVYDLFTQPGEKYELFARLARETQIPEARRIFDNIAGCDNKIITSYTSVLGDGGLNLWADPLVRAATSKSDFSIHDLRRRRSTVYLCVSPNDLLVIAPLIRLFFQQVVSVLQRTLPGRDERHEVLFLLDEFKHLGKMESIETAVTTMAGYGGRFMFVIQSLAALTGAYGQAGKENFLSNCGIQVFMATADDETPSYISKAIGDYTYRARALSYNWLKVVDANYQLSEHGANLIRPEQIRLLNESAEIVLIKGKPPAFINKIKYYDDCILGPIFDAQSGSLPEPDILVLRATRPDETQEQRKADSKSSGSPSSDMDAFESNAPHSRSIGHEGAEGLDSRQGQLPAKAVDAR
jgi:type IV secretion system protein VirD4